MENLALVPVGETSVPGAASAGAMPHNHKSNPEKEKCLYWIAIAQLPVDSVEEQNLEIRDRWGQRNACHSVIRIMSYLERFHLVTGEAFIFIHHIK